ncbi:ubiquinone/menaquinone biosynthesis protein [Mycobacterium sp. 1245111.1]|uniref:methyltransferase domain-containing protein n=1 Tax=Mycobacterium sp. 1245111.1 TaxID=1834073 RepID=UPI0007FD2B1B|nr:methyltransferase domain-containing protein [Mycobacterium sp. 1245111.1]OBK35504.1 ubiquinone/menaquinone biosynthesis protein [Mycobacterium sp. 1245111.1]
MPPRLNLFTNRQRANSFGGAAQNYDAHRPRYPDQLIDDVLAPGARCVLEAGAGTGIASMQLIERGADLLAVEPDARMAAVAQAKGIPVELATFEDWDPAGRRFDRVVFAASFHWVDPAVALPKIRAILADGGKLALIWNRLRPTNPTRAQFEEIYRDYMDIETHSGDGSPGEVVEMIAAAGFTVTQQTYRHDLHYSAEQWVDIAFTFSKQLLVTEDKAPELRARLIERIGPAGVSVGGDAVAIFATPD